MRVFIAGATGVLGRRVVAACVDRGHDVVGLTRDDRGDDLVREHGGEPHRGDVLDPATLVDGAAGADVVVHAATAVPTSSRPTDEEWTSHDRVRREGADHLLTAAADAGVDRFVLQSIVWVARRPDGRPFDEDAAPHPDRSTRSAVDAERLVIDRADDLGLAPVVLRDGWFYAGDAPHTREFAERLLARRLPIVGRGPLGREDAVLSFVHADDAGRAFAAAVAGDAVGTFHVVDDNPTTYADFLQSFADRLGAPPPRRIPAWMARLLVDDVVVRMVTCPMPTSNEGFREAFDWEPRYPTVHAGLEAVVEGWREDGTIRRRGARWHWAGA